MPLGDDYKQMGMGVQLSDLDELSAPETLVPLFEKNSLMSNATKSNELAIFQIHKKKYLDDMQGVCSMSCHYTCLAVEGPIKALFAPES